MLNAATPLRQRGASLIEIVVVMAILAGLLSAVMPSVSDWLRGLKVRTAADSMRNGMEIARMEALKRNTTVTFWLVQDGTAQVPGNACVLSSSSAAWVVSVVDPTGACGVAASLTETPQLVQHSTGGENAPGLSVSAISAAGNGATRVSFDGLGRVANTAAGIHLVDVTAASGTARQLRVMVDSGGAIRMCDRGVTAPDPRACPST
ncbi:GspH/FimT family pseudopilin [Roseateles koreensis]|uniref:Type II secretion system protein H n=1 Tax=Roseateles koreensis TaxID=2987526 RepID=A0ABT5KRM1_9BURK|nr:GspH/FimT family pseudopilin [Roseateles koreensis]MDC8785491.1 GspH/FimT family pseudopilin [Roseateles koreensis]